MQTLLFVNLSNYRVGTKITGGSTTTLPKLTAGDSARLAFRFTQDVEGVPVEVTRTVNSLRASIGKLDARPTAGFFLLRVGDGPYTEGVNQTTPISFDATSAAVKTALDALGDTVSVIAGGGSWVIEKTDGTALDLSGVSASGIASELKPLSFVRVAETQVDTRYRYEVRLTQAPLASTSTFDVLLPPAPTVTEIQAGGTDGEVTWPEIQALFVSPTFRGTYQIRRGFKKSVELSIEDGPEELQAAMDALADEGETFLVTNPAPNTAHIAFEGDMRGTDQDLLTIEVFSAPAGDPTVTIDLNTAEVAEALRTEVEVKALLEVEITFEDEVDSELERVVTPIRVPVIIQRDVNWGGLEAAANVDWLRPPHGKTYVPFTPDQIITGAQNYVAPVGDGVATEYALSHNLGTRDLHVSLRQNATPFARIPDNTYTVELDSDDVVTLTFSTPPTTNQYVAVISTAGPVSAFQAHTHTIAQVENLQTILDDLGTRLETLEDLIPSGATDTQVTPAGTVVAQWELPPIFEVFPTRQTIDAVSVVAIKPADLPRSGGLLPAVEAESITDDLGTLPVSPAEGVVYGYYDEETPLVLPGYLGRKSVKLLAASPTAPATYAWDGRGFYQVEKVIEAEDVFYPKDFTRELFRIYVNEKQLRLGKLLSLDFSFVAALFNVKSTEFNTTASAQWAIVIDIGFPTQSPEGTSNISDIEFLAPSLDHTFVLTQVPSAHSFGLRIKRALVEAVDTTTIERVVYGALEAAGDPLTSNNFVIRGRLARFDTSDGMSDPRGLVAFQGMDLAIAADGLEYGKATIK